MSSFINGACANGHLDVEGNRYSSYPKNRKCKACQKLHQAKYVEQRSHIRAMLKKGPEELNKACDLLTLAAANLWSACNVGTHEQKMAYIDRADEQLDKAIVILRK